ncbi:MAG: multicopper oxidase domain-containing protein [Acidobacteriota bacterium]
MRTTSFRPARGASRAFRLGLVCLAAGVLPWLQPVAAQAATTDTGKPTGIACTTDGATTNPTFTLEAKPGYIQLPDGTTAYMWSYANGGAAFQHPGPVLCVNQNDTVTVILTNSLPEPVSIMFPGQENVLADGAPAQPQFSGVTATSLTNAVAPGASITYSFVASNPGSYIYESGTLPHKQVRMGLFGALVVRPTQGASYMYNRTDSRYTTSTQFSASGPQVNEEYMVLLSELDPYLHWATEANYDFDFNYYHPRYWLINGRGFPDSISDNFSTYLPDQPYGALARIHPKSASHPYPGAIRYLNVGTEEFPYHPHGNNGRVIGRDGRPLAGPAGEDLSMEKFAINIGPGQAWDVLFDWYDAEGYASTPPSKNVPVTIPQVNNQEFGIFYSGSPYLGQTGPLPPGASTLNTCGEYYVISHNHALFQMSSWGVNATGPITYVRIDPPLPNSCQ